MPGVHPRIRGEDPGKHLFFYRFIGSPPHTRGRFFCSSLAALSRRFTPAYAGKIVLIQILIHVAEVHPRIRGEDLAPYKFPPGDVGSPPHTRGRLWFYPGSEREGRFTPAYAGKIPVLVRAAMIFRVHPRIRGEDFPYFRSTTHSLGSPPHTRGRSGLYNRHDDFRGFTPAYAGKIGNPRPYAFPAWVHPRIRGEDFSRPRKALLRTGSPPHTRGRCDMLSLNHSPPRFTPAYAGKIHGDSSRIAHEGVHPRIRGEDPEAACGAPWA